MLYAKVSAVVRWSGGTVVLTKGKTTADPDHPLVSERPDLWTELPGDADLQATRPRIERATQAPGEQRGPLGGTKKAAAKKAAPKPTKDTGRG